MLYRFHRKSPWLKRVLVPFWALQLIFMLALLSAFVWLRAYSGFQNINIVVLIISVLCAVLSVTEIILFAATKLHPRTYLILQLVKTIMWLVPFVMAAVDTTREQNAMNRDGEQGYNSETNTRYFFLEGFVGTLVLFITFLGSLIYASIIYHRHRRAKTHFLHSIHGTDLFPVTDDEAANPANSHRTPQTSSADRPGAAATPRPAATKEAVEVTLLRELGGDWEVYELPATRSKRSSRGGKSVRSVKGVR